MLTYEEVVNGYKRKYWINTVRKELVSINKMKYGN